MEADNQVLSIFVESINPWASQRFFFQKRAENFAICMGAFLYSALQILTLYEHVMDLKSEYYTLKMPKSTFAFTVTCTRCVYKNCIYVAALD